MYISFCTPCANRLYQLRQTFDANLTTLMGHSDVEWIIVNLGSKDELHAFMMERLPQVSANIIYAHDASSFAWHMCRAKNIAHKLARGRVLMNLDCDNFIGNSIDVLKKAFGTGTKAMHLWSGVARDGTCGRVAIASDLFHELGGYDESFFPVGYDDSDLIRRIERKGVKVETSRCAKGSAIVNSKEESLLHCELQGMTWEQCTFANRDKSVANIAAGKLTANLGTSWGKANFAVLLRSAELTTTVPKDPFPC